VLGIPIGTLMSRLSRGREQQRRLLEGDGPPRIRRVK
jgi:DNA-directed RNA polymerase specialized sigma24 family protein